MTASPTRPKLGSFLKGEIEWWQYGVTRRQPRPHRPLPVEDARLNPARANAVRTALQRDFEIAFPRSARVCEVTRGRRRSIVCAMTLYPHLLAAARPRLHPPAQPRADGLDAYRPRGARRLGPGGRILRRARPRRGRPHRHRRHRARTREGAVFPDAAGMFGRAGCGQPPAGDRPGPCRGRPDRDADPARRAAMPTGATASARARSNRRSPRSPRARSTQPASRNRSPISPPPPPAPARRATTGSRSWAARATCSTSSSPATPTGAPTIGAGRTRTGCACPSRWSGGCARPWGRISS